MWQEVTDIIIAENRQPLHCFLPYHHVSKPAEDSESWVLATCTQPNPQMGGYLLHVPSPILRGVGACYMYPVQSSEGWVLATCTQSNPQRGGYLLHVPSPILRGVGTCYMYPVQSSEGWVLATCTQPNPRVIVACYNLTFH